MSGNQRRNRRLIELVSAMKRREFPNTRSLARAFARRPNAGLTACQRTLQRDIGYLQLTLDAPVEYDEVEHGYYLTDPEWVFPLDELHGDLLYASLLGEQLSLPMLPPPFRSSLETVLEAQLAAADPEDVDADLLRAVVFATGATVDLEPDAFETIHAAWRDTACLEILYQAEDGATPASRRVDIHALFLAQGAWYARAYCHLRDAWRSLALHRIRAPRLLPDRFLRAPAALAQIQSGNVFDYTTIHHVTILCSPAKTRVIAEREWFPGQQTEPLPDGSLRLHFPEAPRRELLWWVLSYAGHLEVAHPPDLRHDIRQAAELLVARHAPEPQT